MANTTSKRKEREGDSSELNNNAQSPPKQAKRAKVSVEHQASTPSLPASKPRKKCRPSKAKPLPKPKAAPLPEGLIRSRKFWFPGADLILKADKTLFRVHRKKLTSMGGMLEHLLSSEMVSPNPEDYIDGLPVLELPDLLDDTQEAEWLLAFIYERFFLVTFLDPEKEDSPQVHWPASIAFLHIGHKLDMFAVQNAAIEALSYIFPSGESVPDPKVKPKILGLATNEKATFAKLHVFQAIKAFDDYRIIALKPMSYYQAAQFSYADIVNGVPRPDGTLEELPRHIVLELISLVGNLRKIRQREAFGFFLNLTEDGKMHSYPSDKCPNHPGPSGATCFHYLLRLYLQLIKSGFLDETADCLFVKFSDPALVALNRHLCKYCMAELRKDMDQASKTVWKQLPRNFGYEGWTDLLVEQHNRDKAWQPDLEFDSR